MSKEACKLFLKAALFKEFHTYIKNANHSIENLTNNSELETCDGQRLLRWLETVSSTFQDVAFDGALLPLFIS